MAQEASAVSATAAPTHKRKVAFVGGTAGEMGSALHQVAPLLLFLAKVFAPSTAAAVENHVRLMAAAPTHKREACAVNMVHSASAVPATASATQ